MAELWASTLCIDVGALNLDDNFRELGGTAIHIVSVLAAVKGRFGVVIPFIGFLNRPTFRLCTPMKIVQCEAKHLEAAAELFDKYRMFYEQPSDPAGAKAFVKANLEGQRSLIFLLVDDDGRAVAFSQLYPSYCSIAMRPFYYLSDLYVDPSARRKGHAKVLMEYLGGHFGEQSIQRLTLETATTNLAAQALYESLGYEQEKVFITYHKIL